MKPQDLNWNPLFAWINQTLGIEVEMSMDFSGDQAEIVCSNLLAETGIFKSTFKEIKVGFLGFWETKNDEGQIIGYAGTVNLFYYHWSGAGPLAAEIGMFWIQNGQWKFDSSRVRYAK